MKQILLAGVTAILSFARLNAQNTDPYVAVTKQITEHFNSKNYKAFYGLLSPAFAAEQSEAQITQFLKNLHATYGSVNSIRFLGLQEPFARYKASCSEGELEMLLACNGKQEIEGLSFMPYAEPVSSQRALQSNNPMKSPFDRAVDSLVRAYLSDPATAGLSIAVVKNGQETYYHYGEVKKGSGQLPGNNSLYEIGSVTKTFTGILLAKAIEEHKVSAGDDIRQYLPPSCSKLAYKQTPVTLVQLANHTAGIPRIPDNLTRQKAFDPSDPYRNYTKDMLFADLAKLRLKRMPGTVADYSNSGMALLGIILSDVYGKSYDALVKEKITGPLHMLTTGNDVPVERLNDFCFGYDEKGKQTSHWNFADMSPAGGLRSTPEDMMRYLRANLDAEDSAINTSHAPTFRSNNYNGVGMAWQLQQNLSGDELVWHNGGTYGFSSFLAFMKSRNCGILILGNCGKSVDGLAIQLLKELKK